MFQLRDLIKKQEVIVSNFLIGYEKEFIIVATDSNGVSYNVLDLGSELMRESNGLTKEYGFDLRNEYSRCLMEIVTPPYKKEDAQRKLRDLNKYYLELNSILTTIKANFPKLAHFKLELFDSGGSHTRNYVTINGNIIFHDDVGEELVEQRYEKFVRDNLSKKFKLTSSHEDSKLINYYSHINSFHITFNPTYCGQSNFQRFFKSYNDALRLVDEYKNMDVSNRIVMLEKEITIDSNLRDLFFDQFFKKIHPRLPSKCRQSQSNDSFILELETTVNTLSKEGMLPESIDMFSTWPSLNIRPRITKNGTFLAEIRAFSSSFSHQAEDFIKKITELD